MNLFSVSLPYGTEGLLRKLSLEDYAKALVVLKYWGLPEDQEKLPQWYNYNRENIVDTGELEAIVAMGVQPTLHKIRGLSYSGALPSAVQGNADIDAARQVSINVSVSGTPLHTVDEVTWYEDCCTEKLQDGLNDGWRILCVCPPHDQRRPTYILGRNAKRHATKQK